MGGGSGTVGRVPEGVSETCVQFVILYFLGDDFGESFGEGFGRASGEGFEGFWEGFVRFLGSHQRPE